MGRERRLTHERGPVTVLSERVRIRGATAAEREVLDAVLCGGSGVLRLIVTVTAAALAALHSIVPELHMSFQLVLMTLRAEVVPCARSGAGQKDHLRAASFATKSQVREGVVGLKTMA